MAATLPATFRRLHGWLGSLFAPGLIFFAASGLVQVFDLHKPQPARDYQPPAAVRVMAALHKDQTLHVHEKDAAKPAKEGDGAEHKAKSKANANANANAKAAPERAGLGSILLKAYATATSVVLALTTMIGLYLAFRSPRDRAWNLALLTLGLLAPIGFMLLN
ncbi:hypothetical protein [Phenylobacterium sp.]|uniref:hypothetical protein n=1 Tax=Phenylobacterium sp. TaxID=1871053 RepID=UPI00120AAFCF|nr:hypothetical protein [Phenylobacterium sp.]THD57309.1 MAG: hypothetical protein E8A12_13615 [Phenylobacterium sp.]